MVYAQISLVRCLDDAIAGAVTEYGRQRNQFTLDGETARGNERAEFLAHELRNLLNTAIVAFDVLQTGNVGVGGSTARVLHRSPLGARNLSGQSLAEVRLTHGVQNREQFLLAAFIAELAPAAALEANAKGITLVVMPVENEVAIEAGLRLGLAFSRLGVEANGGRIYARNLPDRGCVFIIDLPRLERPVVASVCGVLDTACSCERQAG